ncbi:hypothetical protein Prudu_012565, partial [Prunus dulcis]
RPSLAFDVATATTLGTDLRRGTVGTVTRPPFFFRPTPASEVPESGRKTMISDDGSPIATRTSSSDFSSVSPPTRSSKAPGVQLIHRRDLREVQLARTSCHRRTKETTRAISLASDPHQSVEDLGFGQFTGETLPNFWQKSEGNY